jgi:hypothetical protein
VVTLNIRFAALLPFLKVPLFAKVPLFVSVNPFSSKMPPLLMVTPAIVVLAGRVTEFAPVVAMVTLSPTAGLPELAVQVLAVVQDPPVPVLVQAVAHAVGASASMRSVRHSAQGTRKAGRATVFRRVTSCVFMDFNWFLAVMGFGERQIIAGDQNRLTDKAPDGLAIMIVMSFSRPRR